MRTERQIQRELNRLATSPAFQSPSATRTERTRRIKEAIAGWAGRVPGWTAYYTGHPTESEWMFDVTALELDDGWLANTALVVESELGSEEEVHNDFQRLLTAKADLRVMIFQTKQILYPKRLICELKEAISRYKKSRPEDRYLIAYYPEGADHFECQSFSAGQANT